MLKRILAMLLAITLCAGLCVTGVSADGETVTVHFDANGGTSGTMADQTFTKGEAAKALTRNTLSRSGYAFLGWNTAPDGGGVVFTDKQKLTYDELSLYGGEVTLYAQWSLKIGVTCDRNGGEAGSYAYSGLAAGGSIKPNDSSFTWSGYALIGWSVTPGGAKLFEAGATITYEELIDYADANAKVTLYAVWETAHTVHFERNGGTSGTMADQPFGITQGEKTLTKNSFTLSGYTFDHWNTAADDSGTSYANEEILSYDALGGDLTLYAQWRRTSYTLTLMRNDGTTSKSTSTRSSGDSWTLTASNRSGYEFIGWSLAEGDPHIIFEPGDTLTYEDLREAENDESNPLYDYIVDGKLTLYAQWVEIVTVVFNANNGAGTMAQEIFYAGEGAKPLTENVFTRNKSTFTGWNTKQDGSGVALMDGQMLRYEDLTGEELSRYLTTNARLTLYAQWAETRYVLFWSNCGLANSMETEYYAYGEEKPLTANAYIRDGYTFTGWNTKQDGSGVAYDDQQLVRYADLTGNLVLYAQWREYDDLVLTVDANGGEGSASYAVSYGQTKGFLFSGVSREGYTLVGWNTAPDGSGAFSLEPRGMISYAQMMELGGNVTLYAQWERSRYVLRFMPNGGEGEPFDNTCSYNGTGYISSLNRFTRTHYTLVSYNTKPDGTGRSFAIAASVPYAEFQEMEAAGLIASDGENEGVLFLYAQWEEFTKYTLSYDANGGEGEMTSSNFYHGDGFIAAENAFTYEHHRFLGWNTKADGTGKSPTIGARYVGLNEDVTLYAQWEAANRLRYDANGGEGEMEDLYYFGNSFPVAKNVFTREGYYFIEWNTKADGSGTRIKEEVQYSAGWTDTTLYAQWGQLTQYTLSYDANGGEGEMTSSNFYHGDGFIAAENAFTYEHHRFLGWNTKADGTGKSPTIGARYVGLNEDVTLYAQWEAAHRISYDANGGEGEMEDQYYYDNAFVTAENGFTREGFVFRCWNTKADGSGTSIKENADYRAPWGDFTLYAQWELIQPDPAVIIDTPTTPDTDTAPDPDSNPNPNPNPNPDPDPDRYSDSEEIPEPEYDSEEEETEIEEEEVPLAELPEEEEDIAEEEEDIAEKDIPLDGSPETGDNKLTALWVALAVVSLAGIAYIVMPKKRKD